MGHLLHGSARTTAAVRRAIQHSQERIGRLAERYGIKSQDGGQVEKTRPHVHDAPMGPKPVLHRAAPGRRSPDRGISQAYAAAAG